MDSRQFDVRFLQNLAIPFDAQTKELADGARIVSGSNTVINQSGKITQAPGLNNTPFASHPLTGRIDRLAVYETSESSPKVFIMASVFNGTTWDAKFLRLASSPAWTSVGSLRSVNASITAHEFGVARGLCYIRFFLASGPVTVVFDGSGASPVLTSWGLTPPSSAPGYSGNFGTTTTVALFGWRYAYAYVNDVSGHVSSRSRASVSTGAVLNANPRITGAYSTDTTVSDINIYRTFDGGGTFYFLAQIANNTAGGTFTYNDDDSGVTAGDATLDSELDTRNIAPSEVSNDPPATAATATASSNEISTPIVYYARRWWYGIGNRLFYSGQEEILNGVPEESFPNPFGLRGNYYVLQGQLRQLKPTRRALYITTANEVGVITGQDKTNFLFDTLVPDISGALVLNPGSTAHAITAFRDSVFFLSADFQIYKVTGANPPEIISGPLGSNLQDLLELYAGSNALNVEFEIYSFSGNVWLVVNVANITDSTVNRQFVYDLNRQIWFTPWAKRINAITFGRRTENIMNRELIVAHYDGTTSKLAVLDFDTLADVGTNFTPSAVINLATVPSGNHINELRKWAHAPMLSYFIIERTKIASDTDPTVAYRLDEFSGSTTAATAFDPPYEAQHTSYIEKWYPVQQVAKRVQISITGTGGQRIELQNIGFVYQSEAGA
jgi:hypothetical protein